MKKKKPHGREEVMASVLDAAAELFSEYGVSAVSIRDVAEKANVNHGLIHRHFGSKDNLRRKVQENLAAASAASVGDLKDFHTAVSIGLKPFQENTIFIKVLARTLLDGQYEGELQSEFPHIKKMVALAGKAQKHGTLLTEMDPAMVVAGTMALSLGLTTYKEYILSATGLDDDTFDDMVDKIYESWLSLLNR